MSSYHELVKTVNERKVKFYFLLSIPRSRSTALQLCLSQAPEIDGQINLPFNPCTIDGVVDISVEEASQRILNIINPAISTAKKLVRFIIHEHFDFLTQQHLLMLERLSTNFIFCIREPKIQFLSHLLASLNMLFVDDSDTNSKNIAYFSYDDLLTLLVVNLHRTEDFDTKIRDIAKHKNIRVCRQKVLLAKLIVNGYNNICSNDSNSLRGIFKIFLLLNKKNLNDSWDNLLHILNLFKSVPNKKYNIQIVDGEIMVKDPGKTLRTVIDSFGDVSFSEEIISNWGKYTGKDFICYMSNNLLFNDNNVWNGKSKNSTGITREQANHRLEEYLLDEDFKLVLQKAEHIYQYITDSESYNL